MDSAQKDDGAPSVSSPPPSTNNLSSELEHVTQEMYKKNAELFHTNKTLSLLQKIEAIILSSVTDLWQVAQQVVDVIASEAEFKRVAVFIINEQQELARIAASSGEAVARAEFLVKKQFPSLRISMHNEENLLVKVAKTAHFQYANNYFDILVPDFAPQEAETIQQTLNVKSIYVFPLIIRDEVIGVLSISLSEISTDISDYELDLMERLAGIIGIAIDSSLLYRSIQEANEKLKQLDKLKDEFVSLASHELRTPMTVIKSYIWMLLEGKAGEVSEKQKSYLERTYTSTDRLINMVNDMLNISRIESGRLTIEPKALSMPSLIQEVVGEMQTRAGEQQLSLLFPAPQGEVPNVFADPDKIKQVLINLIGNSLKFTPAGGNITLICEQRDGYVVTHVKDTGKGIKAEDMDKLFRKFNMLGSNYLTKQSGQGTGLGLYLSKSLVELHKGRIWVASQGEGKGTTCSFSLPVMSSGMQTKTPKPAVAQGTT